MYLIEGVKLNKIVLLYKNTKAEILLDKGDAEGALKIVNNALNISPKNFPLSVLKAKILSYKKELFAAEEIIRDQLLRRNTDPYLWLYLSEIQRDSKNVVGYHRSRAEYFLLLGVLLIPSPPLPPVFCIFTIYISYAIIHA